MVKDYTTIHLCDDCKFSKDFRQLKLEVLIRKNKLQDNEMAEQHGY